MKHEWRKQEKEYYLPKDAPVEVVVPAFNFYTIKGQGNPNDDFFAAYVKVLYALSYGVKMSLKKGPRPTGYTDYAVYPLEGVWDISEEAKKKGIDQFDKSTLIFELMIRQPNFVNEAYALEIREQTKKRKPYELLDQVQFHSIEDGHCIQMLHVGPYDSEPVSFELMEEYAFIHGLKRVSKTHREIYLTDARKVAPEKLKTVLRFSVE